MDAAARETESNEAGANLGRLVALAMDYDGTIAHHGEVAAATFDALARLKRSGRRLILVTGRNLDDLRRVFAGMVIFDRIIAENGGAMYDPVTAHEHPL